jgi:hypothetical protein
MRLRMNTRQHEHRNEYQCRSRQGKVRCFRYDIRENMAFGHDSPPAKSLENQGADETWGWVVEIAIARSKYIIWPSREMIFPNVVEEKYTLIASL